MLTLELWMQYLRTRAGLRQAPALPRPLSYATAQKPLRPGMMPRVSSYSGAGSVKRDCLKA